MNIENALAIRSAELCCILAGCVAINTLETLELTEKLHNNSLTNKKARDFILGMRERLPELQQANEEKIVNIIMQVCHEKKCLWDYAYWLTLVRDATKDAQNAVKEIQKITITLDTLKNLQEWLKQLEAWVESR